MERILVVEDEYVIARDIELSLGRMGYRISGLAASGEEALRQISETQPDLVLMDIVLKGGVDGVEAGARIREQWDIPIVYLTAYGDRAFLERALGTGPQGYLLKPFAEASLYAALKTAFHRHRLERDLREAAERRRAEEAAVAVRLQTAVEEERVRLAREVHDHLGQALVGLRFDLMWLARRLPPEMPGLGEKVEAMLRCLTAMLERVRDVSSALRPGLVDDLGLVEAVAELTREFETRTGIACRSVSCPAQCEVDLERRRALVGILQESLANVARHARATGVAVSLRVRDQALELEVTDDGRGITDAEAADPRAVGLLGMRERVRPFGGSVVVRGTPGRGTTVCATVPLA